MVSPGVLRRKVEYSLMHALATRASPLTFIINSHSRVQAVKERILNPQLDFILYLEATTAVLFRIDGCLHTRTMPTAQPSQTAI